MLLLTAFDVVAVRHVLHIIKLEFHYSIDLHNLKNLSISYVGRNSMISFISGNILKAECYNFIPDVTKLLVQIGISNLCVKLPRSHFLLLSDTV